MKYLLLYRFRTSDVLQQCCWVSFKVALVKAHSLACSAGGALYGQGLTANAAAAAGATPVPATPAGTEVPAQVIRNFIQRTT